MKLTIFYYYVTCCISLNSKLQLFPIISAYSKEVSRFLARRRTAKMERKLLKGGSEIAGRFGNFSSTCEGKSLLSQQEREEMIQRITKRSGDSAVLHLPRPESENQIANVSLHPKIWMPLHNLL